jgi:hypothetical protein
MSFDEEVAELGFEVVQQRRDGSRQYSRRANPYLAFWLLVGPDGGAQLSWEFELGEYLKAKGFSIGAQDELSLLLFPGREEHGSADAGWVAGAVARADELLRSVDMVSGT